MPGVLYLLPVPLAEGEINNSIPANVRDKACELRHFVAENAKTARAMLKRFGTATPLRDIQISELNEHTPEASITALLEPLLAGHDIGLMSEAGCPAIADPGANLVAAARRQGIPVVPLVGPSSLLLALMASGLNGQQFAFNGYLPVKDGEREQRIKMLEKESRHLRRTQLFIETPYRNQALLEALLRTCQPQTRLCLASDLTGSSESIHTHTIADWQKQAQQQALPDFSRRPTVFLLLAS